jgi:ketosteroid isomerase-like protein
VRALIWTAVAALLAVPPPTPAAQSGNALPMALEQILEAERILASRTGVQREPRVGDVAASGELGYLVGPHRHDRETGDAAHGVYLGVWKRQRDGRFAQVVQVDTTTPGRPSFPAGFTMATPAGRFAEYDDTTPPLATADSLLNAALRTDQAKGYQPRLAGEVRLHRPSATPLVGARAILRWAGTQPALDVADTRYAESARSGDLGYTRGDYALRRAGRLERGEYVRVWVRERDGQWILALDALRPASGGSGPR